MHMLNKINIAKITEERIFFFFLEWIKNNDKAVKEWKLVQLTQPLFIAIYKFSRSLSLFVYVALV